MKDFVDVRADFFVGSELSLVELAEPRLEFLAKPSVVVKIVLDELADVFFRAAIIFCRDVCQLCLEFRAKIHFHKSRLGPEIATVKRTGVRGPNGRRGLEPGLKLGWAILRGFGGSEDLPFPGRKSKPQPFQRLEESGTRQHISPRPQNSQASDIVPLDLSANYGNVSLFTPG
jgi:hypothetical protein